MWTGRWEEEVKDERRGEGGGEREGGELGGVVLLVWWFLLQGLSFLVLIWCSGGLLFTCILPVCLVCDLLPVCLIYTKINVKNRMTEKMFPVILQSLRSVWMECVNVVCLSCRMPGQCLFQTLEFSLVSENFS